MHQELRPRETMALRMSAFSIFDGLKAFLIWQHYARRKAGKAAACLAYLKSLIARRPLMAD